VFYLTNELVVVLLTRLLMVLGRKGDFIFNSFQISFHICVKESVIPC
jgi:hypothetical protein